MGTFSWVITPGGPHIVGSCDKRGVGDILCLELEFYSASREQFKTRGQRKEAKLET